MEESVKRMGGSKRVGVKKEREIGLECAGKDYILVNLERWYWIEIKRFVGGKRVGEMKKNVVGLKGERLDGNNWRDIEWKR